MAAVAGGRSATATLTAATVDTVTLNRQSQVEIVHHGGADVIYFRVDDTDPVVAADDCEVLLPSERLTVHLDNNDLKLISAGAMTYTVVAVS